MALSEDLTALEAFMIVVAAGEHELTREGADELRCLLARAAEDAARLEDEIDKALADCDRWAPATIPALVLANAIRSGKVVRLAAVRLSRMREARLPGWLA